MGKKKRKSAKKPSDSDFDVPRGGRSPSIGPSPAEAIIRQFIEEDDELIDPADELVDLALDARLPEERVAFARQAIAISPNCADAYVILAHEAPSIDEARSLYEQGVAAARRSLGDERFESAAGHFWGVMHTRPYMRARLGLAQCLWEAGEREEAIGHYRELLRLNPRDNQGVRYLLLGALVDTDQDIEAQVLLEQFSGDASAEWVYTTALLAYRREGESPLSDKLLQAASATNPHVPAYLVGRKSLPSSPPDFVSPGEDDEAVAYVGQFLRNWRGTSGAIPWLRKVLKISLPRPVKVRKPAWSRFRHTFLRLPQVEDEIWQLDVCRLPIPEDETGKMPSPWALVLVNRTADAFLAFDASESQPSASEVWEALIEAILRPRSGEPHRPAAIEVRRKTFWNAWHEKLERIEVPCRLCDELEGFDEVLENLIPQPGSFRRFLEGIESQPETDGSELAELPQSIGETWQADLRRLPGWLEHDGELRRPWAVLVTNCDDQVVLVQNLSVESPDADWIWLNVVEAIRQPMIGEPHRPGIIQVSDEACLQVLSPRLEAVGVNCVLSDNLEHIDEVFGQLGKYLAGGKSAPPMIEVPGVKLDDVRGFFEAAAEFYRQAPWRLVPGDFTIKIECDKFQTNTWYAVVMGQTGLVLGLALYEDLAMLESMFSGTISDDEISRQAWGLSVMFGEAFEIPIADLDAAEKYHWPVASPEAYPNPVFVNPGRSMRPPLAWELALLEGSLRAIPRFILERQPSQTISVSVASGELVMKLSRAVE